MKTNMLNADRLIRFILALIFAAVYFRHLLPPTLGFILLIVGIVFLVTSFTGFCPIYWLLGFKGKEAGK